jgi:hypothetical protein
MDALRESLYQAGIKQLQAEQPKRRQFRDAEFRKWSDVSWDAYRHREPAENRADSFPLNS